jgi:hypothetical protein
MLQFQTELITFIPPVFVSVFLLQFQAEEKMINFEKKLYATNFRK